MKSPYGRDAFIVRKTTFKIWNECTIIITPYVHQRCWTVGVLFTSSIFSHYYLIFSLGTKRTQRLLYSYPGEASCVDRLQDGQCCFCKTSELRCTQNHYPAMCCNTIANMEQSIPVAQLCFGRPGPVISMAALNNMYELKTFTVICRIPSFWFSSLKSIVFREYIFVALQSNYVYLIHSFVQRDLHALHGRLLLVVSAHEPDHHQTYIMSKTL